MIRRAAVRRGLALFVVASLGVFGCDRGDDEGGPVQGGTLRLVTVGAVQLDPAHASERHDVAAADLVYDTLVDLDPETLEPIPGLATAWEVSDDQQRFMFTLDADARFHDGSPLRADDVVTAWSRVVDPATGSPLARLLEPVAGYREARDGEGSLMGLATPDDTTVVVELSAPLADFPVTLAHPGLGIARGDPGEDLRAGSVPVGSGPFAVGHHDEEATRLVAVEDRDVHLEAIEVEVMGDAEAAGAAVAARSADLALLVGDVPMPDGVTEHRRAFLAVSYYAMNVAHPALADERFRSAIVAAVDPDRVVEIGYRSVADVATSLAPTPLPGVGPDVCGDLCGPDRERARELLDDVFGDEPLPTINIDHDDTEVQARAAGEIGAQLEAVGIPVELHPIPADEYDAFLANEDPTLFRLGWVSEVATPHGYLVPVFAPGAPENVAHIDVPEVEASLDLAAGEKDPTARATAYRDAQVALLETSALIPIAQLVTRYAAAPTVRGLGITIFGGFSATEVWLESENE